MKSQVIQVYLNLSDCHLFRSKTPLFVCVVGNPTRFKVSVEAFGYETNIKIFLLLLILVLSRRG